MRAWRSGVLVLAGLTCCLALLVLPPTPPRLLGAVPLVVAAAAAIRPPARWGISVALLLLPYFSFGLMEVVTNRSDRARGALFTVCVVFTFLASLDHDRRRTSAQPS